MEMRLAKERRGTETFRKERREIQFFGIGRELGCETEVSLECDGAVENGPKRGCVHA
jgi:hypothetical protein